jgi:hypothetical protein
VLGVKIAQWRQPLRVTRRMPFANAPIAQGFDRDRHNLWDTTCIFALWSDNWVCTQNREFTFT